ncbi:MAG: hypothetical protein HC796_00020 [Synechococcaceae cyanobacterium RL_1_2]|nr:hypothetical protein [Synechococcaceae cyanobacterium RL_1_2]
MAIPCNPWFKSSFPDILNDGYSPKEQYQIYNQANPATDIYGLAAILFFMLTGHTPLPAPDRQTTPWQDWQTYAPSFPAAVQKIMLEGLKIHNQDRPQSMQEWLELWPNNLETIQGQHTPDSRVTLPTKLPPLHPRPESNQRSSNPMPLDTPTPLPEPMVQEAKTEIPPELVPNPQGRKPSTQGIKIPKAQSSHPAPPTSVCYPLYHCENP